MSKRIRLKNNTYRNLFLVQNRDYWVDCPFDFDKEKDLVLSLDFAVVKLVRSTGGEAQYIDHIVNADIVEKYNYKTYEFFARWHYNSSGQDIFEYRDIDVGSSFRIEIWNDITFYVRIFLNLQELLKRINYELIYTGIDNSTVEDILQFMNISTVNWTKTNSNRSTEYFFPIFQWMDEKLHPRRLKYKVKVVGIRIFDRLMNFIERFKKSKATNKYVYIEKYHPTQDIIVQIKKAPNIVIVRSDFYSFSDMVRCLHLPVLFSDDIKKYNYKAEKMIDRFVDEKSATLFIDGIDISGEVYRLILKRISPMIAKSLMIVDTILDFYEDRRLSLMITFSNIGIVNRLMINYCKKYNIPIYLIINGFLLNSFLDEAKEGTWINSYSESIKMNYFKNMDNIVCLGDPRMDKYSTLHYNSIRPDYEKPTIGIAASGFTNVDLNCYLSIEFDFLNDILNACNYLKKNGKEMDIIIKIRPNGYMQQYIEFIEEYFPDTNVKLFDSISMENFYKKSDFIISIYSQTLFEASCLGLPVLYYKNDTQFFHPPFDGESEVTTATSPDDLIQKICAFYNRDPIYDAFKDKKIMEKYVGPLDGNNLKRNMDFIYSLLDDKAQGVEEIRSLPKADNHYRGGVK